MIKSVIKNKTGRVAKGPDGFPGNAMSALIDPLILDDLKKSAERPALRYGLSEAGHERG